MPSPEKEKKLSPLESLTKDVRLHILSFFTPQQKQACSRISGEFKKMTSEMSFGTYYLAGNHIRIADDVSQFFMMRSNVPAKEIVASFPTDDKVELFKTFEDAKQHSRSLKIWRKSDHPYSDRTLCQPAIFTVKLLEHPGTMKPISFTIRPSYDAPPFVIRADCIKANACNVVPVRAELKVDFYNNGRISDLGLVESPLDEQENNKRRCVVS